MTCRPASAASLFALVACLLPAASGQIKVLDRTPVFVHTTAEPDDPGNQNFNHAPSVVLLPDGRLLAVWFSGPFEGSPLQRLVGSFSTHDGRSWSMPAVIQDFPDKADFDPAFIAAGNRVYLFFSARLRLPDPSQPASGGPAMQDALRIYSRRSDDSARSWSLPEIVYAEAAHTSRTNGIRLAGGELLLPLHRTGTRAGGVLKSGDGGKTWDRFGRVANPSGEGGEPTIAELKSGRILMVLRTRDGDLWRAFSGDRGETWTVPEKTGLTGSASSANLFRTRSGCLVLTHNPERARTPLTLRISGDEGRTWGQPTLIDEAGEPVKGRRHSVCYPSVAELPDGSLVVVWARIISFPDERAHYGDIHAARVQIDPRCGD